MTEHTPTPWSCHSEYPTVIISSDRKPICESDTFSWLEKEARANAAHIVHCVNTHDQSQARIKELEAERGHFRTLVTLSKPVINGLLALISDYATRMEASNAELPTDKELAKFDQTMGLLDRYSTAINSALANQKAPDLVDNKVCRPLSEDKPAPVNGESEGRDLPLKFSYCNYRGEVSIRTVTPLAIWYGTTEWHPEPQWLLKAHDLDKNEERDFAIAELRGSNATSAWRDTVAEAYDAGEEAGRKSVESRNSDHILKMEKEIASLKVASQSQWRDIKDAPRDGTEMLLHDGETAAQGYWHDGSSNHWGEAGFYYSGDDVLCCHPIGGLTHFMLLTDSPLPSSPEGVE